MNCPDELNSAPAGASRPLHSFAGPPRQGKGLRRTRFAVLLAVTCLAAGLATGRAVAADGPRLGLPVACAYGETCFIQQYVDTDPGRGHQDHMCGTATYDGHKGTDFRVRIADAQEGVPVLAAAAGAVQAVRDGEPDRIVRTDEDRRALSGRECGNGVLLDHGGGWQTQYCHLRRGSVTVSPGDRIAAGTQIGLVGYSGDAAFAHVHLVVRRDGRTIDPFTARMPDGACSSKPGAEGLWDAGTATLLDHPGDRIAGLGFARTPLSSDALETLPPADPARVAGWPSLVGWLWIVNGRKGDRLRLAFHGPTESLRVRREIVLDRNRAQYIQSLGKKRPAAGWPAGPYRIRATVLRNGRILHRRETSITLD